MKRKIEINKGNGVIVERQITYIPLRYILSALLMLLEIAAMIAIVVALCIYMPYFYIAVGITHVGCIVSVIAVEGAPDYKIPWLLFVTVVPIVGFMCYLIFYSRNLTRGQQRYLQRIKSIRIERDTGRAYSELEEIDSGGAGCAYLIEGLSGSCLYKDCKMHYFSTGEEYFASLVKDLRAAREFIFMEYFIIENGLFWDVIHDILREKAGAGIEVRVIYDDIGCMKTLAGNYYKQLGREGIRCLPFARLRGQANNEFNNRSHRKITVIDGIVGYTGGINIADEYINKVERFGHWKDTGVRMHGDAVNELTRIFLIDYAINGRRGTLSDISSYYRSSDAVSCGFVIPFADGPRPMFDRGVSKSIIISMLYLAKRSVCITTPYMIADNEVFAAIENTALRGVDVQIITPRIPDKKIIMMLTRSSYKRLISKGVKIYEYEPGFIHAKTYIFDGEYAILGTVNLDYRSLVHHFENGVWIAHHPVISDISSDFASTREISLEIPENKYERGILRKFLVSILKVFTPLL